MKVYKPHIIIRRGVYAVTSASFMRYTPNHLLKMATEFCLRRNLIHAPFPKWCRIKQGK